MHRRTYRVLLLSLATLFLVLYAASPVLASGSIRAHGDWGRMPLFFIENLGQTDLAVDYYLQGKDKSVYFTSKGLTFSLARTDPEKAVGPSLPLGLLAFPGILGNERYTVKLDFLNAASVSPVGQDKSDTVISYFAGAEDQWKTGLLTYSSLGYADLWPGIDLVYSGTVGRLKHEFIVAPGADPSDIRLAYRGAEVRLNGQGQLVIETPVASFIDEAPVAYQVKGGRRVPVAAAYAIESPEDAAEDGVCYRFDLGAYDPSLPLVIDPVIIVYCGLIAGSGYDSGSAIAVDSSGCAYVAGESLSPDPDTFPRVVGPDRSYNGGYNDAFVAKIKADGSGFVYCGFIGGGDEDTASGIAVDSVGCAYVAGTTWSDPAFPVKVGPDLTHNGGYYDGFIAKVNASGTALVYCGYIGGSKAGDTAKDVAVDASGCAYVVGETDSTQSSFPDLIGPDLSYNGGESDGYVAKVKADGTRLLYCGYLGGSGVDYATHVAVDGAGSAYISGWTSSSQATFPDTVGPDLSFNGARDAFVAKVKPGGAGLVYCGYIGGSGYDYGAGIAVDAAGCAYVTGETNSAASSFPEKVGPDLTYNGGAKDAFVAKVGSSGSSLTYCGYLGGSGDDDGRDVAVDSAGNAYLTGRTTSTQSTFPEVVGPDLTYNGGDGDAFVARLKMTGSGLDFCGYLGGKGMDGGNGIAVDRSGGVYLTGFVYDTSAGFPLVRGPSLVPLYNDAFVAKIVLLTPPTVTALSPSRGLIYGGNTVSIIGANLSGATSVKFGTTAATDVAVISSTKITCKAPAGALGKVDVTVKTAGGTSSVGGTGDDYYYTRLYQQSDTHILYVGAWATVVDSAASSGSYARTKSSGSSATIQFAGTRLYWLATTGPGFGVASVSVDGKTAITVDLYSTAIGYKKNVWNTGPLSAGSHTVQISWRATTGRYIDLDALYVAGSLTTISSSTMNAESTYGPAWVFAPG